MRISQDVRDYAAAKELDLGTAVELGLKEKSIEFRDAGSEVYREPSTT
jgi:phosphomethylpyrimidine synthase